MFPATFCRIPAITFLSGVLVVVSPAAWGQQHQPRPLPRAHAHNDYRHVRPLLDAIDRGFCGIEADVFLVDGKLLVGHDRGELRESRTLTSLYLDPLLQLARKNGGKVHAGGPMIMLLIDIKEDSEATYQKLRDTLRPYREILSSVEKGRYIQRAVEVVISGDRPIDAIVTDQDRRCGIDGRLADLQSTVPPDLMPLISDRWTSHFRWNGTGEMPDEERRKLRSIVEQAHASGRRIRFWATPETEAMWNELIAANVDHINTDQLDRLRDYLLAR